MRQQSTCGLKEESVMESVGRKRKCMSRKNPQKPNKQSTKLKVSHAIFTKLLSLMSLASKMVQYSKFSKIKKWQIFG